MSKEKETREIRQDFGINEIETITYQNSDPVKAVLRVKLYLYMFIIKKEESSQINHLTFNIKTLEKKRKLYPKQTGDII